MLKKTLLLFISCFSFLCAGSKYSYPEDEYSNAAYEQMDHFAHKIAKEYDLKFLNTCLHDVITGKESGPLGHFGLLFTSRKNLTIEEGRILAYKLALALSKNKKLPIDKQAFKIAFWDQEFDRPLFPYLADIRFFNELFHYSYADPKTQALEKPIIEPFSIDKIPS